ncbi:hypothetical protein [Streptomyces sp. NBC_00081]|uniref:hypothetical protein n=1 Tax=Streptomyces sp. NBC_00081 TaxID=2975646 RepID=UPI0032439FE5
MTGFFDRMAARALGREPRVVLRRRTRFEPTGPAAHRSPEFPAAAVTSPEPDSAAVPGAATSTGTPFDTEDGPADGYVGPHDPEDPYAEEPGRSGRTVLAAADRRASAPAARRPGMSAPALPVAPVAPGDSGHRLAPSRAASPSPGGSAPEETPPDAGGVLRPADDSVRGPAADAVHVRATTPSAGTPQDAAEPPPTRPPAGPDTATDPRLPASASASATGVDTDSHPADPGPPRPDRPAPTRLPMPPTDTTSPGRPLTPDVPTTAADRPPATDLRPSRPPRSAAADHPPEHPGPQPPPDTAAPELLDIVRDHVVPALTRAGLIAPGERLAVRLAGEGQHALGPSPDRTTVTAGRMRIRPAPDGPHRPGVGDVHVHIDRVEVLPPSPPLAPASPPPPPPPPEPARPASVDLEAYLDARMGRNR